MSLVGGALIIVPITIKLKKVNESETHILITSNKATNTGYQVNKVVDKFLGLISKPLSVEVITEETVSQGKSECLGVSVFLIELAVGIVYFIF
jgi:hypothetical protein